MKNGIEIRFASIDDKEDYVNLNLKFMEEVMDDNPYWKKLGLPSREDMENVFEEALSEDKNIIIIVAEIKGRIVGYINAWKCYSIWSMGDTITIDDLYVDSDFRNINIGFRLMEFATDYGKTIGCKRIQLHAESDNYQAHNLYRKLEFKSEDMKFFMKKI